MKRVKNVSLVKRTACAFLVVHAATAADLFVSLDGTHVSPFASWGAAATNIQDAVDLASAGSTVWVSNGVYETGWRTNYPTNTVLKSRLVITNAVSVRSFDPDPAQTIIKGSRDPDTLSNGSNAVRCVYMSGKAMLTGFTITNGATLVPPPQATTNAPDDNHKGGGIFVYDFGTVSNCIIAGNLAGGFGAGIHTGGAGVNSTKGIVLDSEIVGNMARTDGTEVKYGGGGGASYSNLRGCRVINNQGHYGSAIVFGTASNCFFSGNATQYTCYGPNLYNCLIVSNKSYYAVRNCKAYNCTIANNTQWGMHQEMTLVNCIVYYNTSGDLSTNYRNDITYTCIKTNKIDWVPERGNITNAPSFMNRSAGDYRLARNSPCVDAGTNGIWTVNAVDLDNQPRVNNVTRIVDLGCYEYVHPPRGTLCIFQ